MPSGPSKPAALAAAMRALGGDDPPAVFLLEGKIYRRNKIVKHDFWAATAFYACDDGSSAVAKINRAAPFCGIALEFIGRWLCRREVRCYAALRDVPNIPALLGRLGSTGFVHAFAPGRPLAKDLPVPDSFFSELHALMAEIHRHGIAYVDANKRENILVGDDGKPYLIDFQISYDLHELGHGYVNRRILARLQAADRYHVLKHQRRIRPDTLTPEQQYEASRLSTLTKLHRWISKPYFAIRRPLMKRLRASGRLLPEGSK